MHEIREEQQKDPEREADFDKAYQKLVKKFANEQGANMLIPEEDLHRVENRGVDINEVQRKIQEQARKKEEKMLQMRLVKQEKEMEGCTFAPIIYTKKTNKKGGGQGQQEDKRDLNTFLEDQKRFEEQKAQKQRERQDRVLASEQQQITTPMVNEKSKQMLEKRKQL